ncbi:TlpA family protein disulfide reductase [Nocardioides sp.]|uniref:TlpA family protein disulfide reductase n=1 Tax=Nocardioides sp. TaxID=35761 RepID=UPI00356A1057
MRRLLGMTATLSLCVASLVGCSGDDQAPVLEPGQVAPASKIEVDTAELRALKAEAGLLECENGPGGGALTPLTLPCLGGGQSVDLSTLRGPMIISLWQSACTACKKEMPILQSFHERFGDTVALLGIDSTDTFPGTALEQLDERGVTFPQLADPGGDLLDTDEFAAVRGYPYLAFVDDDGSLAYLKAGAVNSSEELETLVETHLGVTL